jgi:16S rRNA (uracil1498-N3)-methyltransferase
MHLFYSTEQQETRFTLSEEESRHAVRVLRLGLGDELLLTNGHGSLFTCKIIDPNPKHAVIGIVREQVTGNVKPWSLHVAIAPTKNTDRFEWFLEKATEIGIDEVTPLFCDHSERTSIKSMRLEKVLVSAMKQSLKATLPQLNAPQSFSAFISNAFPGQKFIAWCETGQEEALHRCYKRQGSALVLIGPEGDFSTGEVQAAKHAGYVAVSLGESRLRTETAGIVACHTINLLNTLSDE